jgi:hypothetical protein
MTLLLKFLGAADSAISSIPSPVWAALAGVLLVGVILVFPTARRHANKAGQRAAGQPGTGQPGAGVDSGGDRRDRALFLGVMIPGFAFLAAVLVGSQRGLVAFGRDDLHWHNGWEYLVPATLDGVGLAFGFLAFRAVRKLRNPDRAVRVAWGAAIASATINFVHESHMAHGSALAGGYLALLSLFVMVMFHELLNQFVEGTEWIVRANPAFSLRWITWPTNTACAWIAWRNHPLDVDKDTKVTVKLAVDHLDTVRAAKRDRRRARDLETAAVGVPPWTWAVPWVRARMIEAALDAERSTWETERTAMAQRLAAAEAEQVNGAARFEAAVQDAEQARAEAERLAEQANADRAERIVMQARCEKAERVLQQVQVEAEQRVARVRAEALDLIASQAEQREQAVHSDGAPTKATRSAAAPNAPRLTDEQALHALLRVHPERDYGWTKREVHRITGAGFGRIDRLLAALAEHHHSNSGAAPEHNSAAAAEQAGAERPDDGDLHTGSDAEQSA